MRDRATERERLYLTAKYYTLPLETWRKPSRFIKGYQDFLLSWTNADPDIPILKQAKAEYAKLK
jgi:hypothetical protein